LSPGREHVVRPARSDSSDDDASVEVLPTNVCGWEAPCLPGDTIGSSGAIWLNPQTLMKLTPCKLGVGRFAAGADVGAVNNAVAISAVTTRALS
jgi:hypothetical protein